MNSNGRDRLDRMLDDALAGYSSAEPLAGLEDRVLRRVRASEATRRRALQWAFALVAAAALVLLAIVMRTPHSAAPKTANEARVQIPAPVQPAVAEKPRVASKHRRSRIAALRARSSEPLPKQEQFPAPTPLTAEEQALRSFVERHPAEAQQVFAQLQKRSNAPIQIEPIQIAPLQIDGAQ